MGTDGLARCDLLIISCIKPIYCFVSGVVITPRRSHIIIWNRQSAHTCTQTHSHTYTCTCTQTYLAIALTVPTGPHPESVGFVEVCVAIEPAPTNTETVTVQTQDNTADGKCHSTATALIDVLQHFILDKVSCI